MALEPAVGIELPVGALVCVDRRSIEVEVVAVLRDAHACAIHSNQNRALAAVRRQLLVDVGDGPNEELLVEELRRREIETRNCR